DDTSPNSVSCSLGGGDELSDRRIRRQIANCNERRRMQSINAGFQNLRSLLPKRDGEKMSKAAILQHTAELIQSLQAEKMRLLEEKEAAIQAKKRRIEDEEARERGLVDELTVALEQERRLRQLYEQQLRERRERETMLSPISAPTAPPLPSSIVDSSLIRPRADIPGWFNTANLMQRELYHNLSYFDVISVHSLPTVRLFIGCSRLPNSDRIFRMIHMHPFLLEM
uniref:BHLH domain-containing protein n=1 Tax=Parascaris univalens TaxID=6257 RepID=A0A915ASN8_PARUN